MKTVYIKTTETCNLDCSHCYTSGSLGKKVFWDIDKVMNFIKGLDNSLPKEEFIHFEFHGGEPFICNPKDLIKVAKFITELDRPKDIGVTSNFVFNLTSERLRFIKDYVNGLGSSFDSVSRFPTEKHFILWKENIKKLRSLYPDKGITINVSLTKMNLDYGYKKILDLILDLKVDYLKFEKITLSGNAIINRNVVPTNEESNQFLYDLHGYVIENNLRDKIEIINLEEIYVKVEKRITNSGTYFRSCESNLYTLNADGTVSGCPNEAQTIHYGDIKEDIKDINVSPKRIFQITKESTLSNGCYDCSLLDYCGGGCYKLHWDETGCPTPKKLLKELLKKGSV